MKTKKKIFCTFVFYVALVFISNVKAGWFGPDSFDECMVDEMKGQSNSAYSHVYKICRDKFPIKSPKLFKIAPKKGEFEYSWHQAVLDYRGSKDPYVAIDILKNNTKYIISKIVAEFSEKECASSVDDDYKYSIKFNIIKPFGKMGGSSYIEKGRTFKCIKIKEIYGHK